MTKVKSALFIFLAAAVALCLASCQPEANPDPDVSSVTINVSSHYAGKGTTLQFGAAVSAVGGASTAVTWEVSGANSAGTDISNAGLLTVDAAESAATLIVTATSDFDDTKFDTANITVLDSNTNKNIGPDLFDEYIRAISLIPGDHTINLTGNVENQKMIYINNAGVNITLNGNGYTVTWFAEAQRNPLFTLHRGKLIIKDITLRPAAGNTYTDPLVVLYNATLEMEAGAVIDKVNKSGQGVWLDKRVASDDTILSGGSFIMSDGTIQNCDIGAGIGNEAIDSSITMNGGTIQDCRVGIGSGATGAEINISGGTISGHGEFGLQLFATSKNNTVNMTGGSIYNNIEEGVFIAGEDNTFNMNGSAVIRDNAGSGVRFGSTNPPINCRFIMEGGTISGNGTDGADWQLGVLLRGPGSSFEKKSTGGVIYGDLDPNANKNAAIRVRWNANSRYHYSTVSSETYLKATIAADDNSVSWEGDWD